MQGRVRGASIFSLYILPRHEDAMEEETRNITPVRDFILFVKENRDTIERLKRRGDFNERQLELIQIIERIIEIDYGDD